MNRATVHFSGLYSVQNCEVLSVLSAHGIAGRDVRPLSRVAAAGEGPVHAKACRREVGAEHGCGR